MPSFSEETFHVGERKVGSTDTGHTHGSDRRPQTGVKKSGKERKGGVARRKIPPRTRVTINQVQGGGPKRLLPSQPDDGLRRHNTVFYTVSCYGFAVAAVIRVRARTHANFPARRPLGSAPIPSRPFAPFFGFDPSPRPKRFHRRSRRFTGSRLLTRSAPVRWTAVRHMSD